MRFCFNWTISGSTTIEAASLAEARERWDAIETEAELLESADQTDAVEDGILFESAPGVFDEVEE